MSRRAIGIDIGPHHIRAVQMVREGDRFKVEKAFMAPMRRSTDQPSETLLELANRHGIDWRADMAVALSSATVFYRDLPADSPILGRIQEGEMTALEESVPVSAEQMLVRICAQPSLAGDRSSVLAVVTSRSALDEQLGLMGQVRPRWVDTEAFALWNAVLANHPDAGSGRVVIGHLDSSRLTLVLAQDGYVRFVRNVPWTWPSGQDHAPLADLIRVTFQKVFGRPMEDDGAVYLSTGDVLSDSAIRSLEQILSVPVIPVNPYAQVVGPADLSASKAILIAEGLAIRALAPRQIQGVDFLAEDRGLQRSRTHPRRESTLCATLVCAIGFVWLIGLWVQHSSLESQHSGIKARMSDLFHKTLPEEKRMVSPLAQVQKRLDQVTREYCILTELERTDRHPLVLLERIGASRKGLEVVGIDDLLINQETVRVQGTCLSFDQVYQWQRRLEEVPGFAKVQVEQPTRDPAKGQVRFTILIEMGGA